VRQATVLIPARSNHQCSNGLFISLLQISQFGSIPSPVWHTAARRDCHATRQAARYLGNRSMRVHVEFARHGPLDRRDSSAQLGDAVSIEIHARSETDDAMHSEHWHTRIYHSIQRGQCRIHARIIRAQKRRMPRARVLQYEVYYTHALITWKRLRALLPFGRIRTHSLHIRRLFPLPKCPHIYIYIYLHFYLVPTLHSSAPYGRSAAESA
jgi:hypothetical protein